MEAASIDWPAGSPPVEAVDPAADDTESPRYPEPGLSLSEYNDALATTVDALPMEDDDGNTHVIKRYGESIGAATAYMIKVETKTGKHVKALDIEAIDTADDNLKSAHLAFITHMIAANPDLRAIYGEMTNKMTMAAYDASPYLPKGWFCEYTLHGSAQEVTTFDPSDMLEHLESGGKADYAIKRLQVVSQL